MHIDLYIYIYIYVCVCVCVCVCARIYIHIKFLLDKPSCPLCMKQSQKQLQDCNKTRDRLIDENKTSPHQQPHEIVQNFGRSNFLKLNWAVLGPA